MAKVTPIKAPANAGGDFDLAPEGVFLARCYKMVDVGTQETTGQYGTKQQRTIYLYWELLQDDDGEEVRMDDGTPYLIFNNYTLSMSPKANLRKHLDSWRGVKFTEEEAAEFEVTKLLGAYCKLQISHSKSKDGQRTYANVDTVMTTKKRPEGVNELVSFSIENPDGEVFNDLPQFLKDKIENAPEWEEDETPTTAAAPAATTPAAPAAEQTKLADDEIDIKDVQF